MERREVLVRGIYAGAGLICAGLGAPAVPYLLSTPKSQSRPGWVNAGNLSDFAPGRPRLVTFLLDRADGWRTGREEAGSWIVNQGNGRISAFSPACTHLGCLYHWRRAARQFVCPCHGSRFAIDGKVIAGPATRPLDRYEVRLEGGRLQLRPAINPEAQRS